MMCRPPRHSAIAIAIAIMDGVRRQNVAYIERRTTMLLGNFSHCQAGVDVAILPSIQGTLWTQ